MPQPSTLEHGEIVHPWVMEDRVFLTAEWRDLAMLNYEMDPSVLLPFVPAGTELDSWNGKTFISLIGFRFLNTRVFGMRIPFHYNFDEINLRFYVRRVETNEVKRGVVFIREIVPRVAIALIARVFYNEQYLARPMSHEIKLSGPNVSAEYSWKSKAGWNKITISAIATPSFPAEGSLEQFITEHYWGYAKDSRRGCIEYRVAHPQWKVWNASASRFEGGAQDFYGNQWAEVLTKRPASAFLAEGSDVTVYRGNKISH